ncbi:MAG: aldo/keto reductase [Armatimonadetes bacterium]|nr:aldo/keto reductase [Armatimonadota bacterium]
MIQRELGQSGIQVTALAMGTWAIGGAWWGGTDEADSIAAIRRGLDEGINLIDTAPMYGCGLSEELVGKAIRGRDRSQIVVATKCGLNWWAGEGEFFFEKDGLTVYRNLRPEQIRYEVEQSLKRLGTDYIDLYQTHWQDATTPIADTMGELLRLKEEGKIRAIGVSNCTPAQMDEYLAVGRIDSNQPLYSMLQRGIEADLLPYCRDHNIAVLAYSPLGQGLLTGKLDPGREFPEGDLRRGNRNFSPENIRRVNGILERLSPWREKYGLNQTQLTLAWTISQPGLTVALCGVRNAAQVADLAPGGRVEIAPEDLAAMESIIAELS